MWLLDAVIDLAGVVFLICLTFGLCATIAARIARRQERQANARRLDQVTNPERYDIISRRHA